MTKQGLLTAWTTLLGLGCVPPRPDPFITRAEIRETLERASDAVNHGEWETLLALSTDDVVWERKGTPEWRIEGRDRVRAFLRQNDGKMEIVSFAIAATRIDLVDPTHARARSTLNELLRFKDTGALLQVVGTYEDTFVREGDGWRFAHRTITPRREWNVPVASSGPSVEALEPGK